MTGKILHDPHDPLVRHCSSILNYVILTKINLSKATKRRILSANRTRERLERKKQATEIELNNVNFDTEITEQVTDLAGVRLRHFSRRSTETLDHSSFMEHLQHLWHNLESFIK